MKSAFVLASLVLSVGLSGCSGASTTDSARSEGPATPGASAPSTTAEPPALGPIPASLRVDLPAPGESHAREIVIDLAEAATAPSVDEAPVEAGMLLAQLNLFSNDDDAELIRSGQPYLLTRAGEWRQFDLVRYGFGATTYGELSMTISSDGGHVAFADPSGLVTVDLRDNTFERFELPVREAILVEWSADASTLFFKDRHPERRPCGPRGCVLDVATGDISTVPFNLFYATRANDGVVFELRAAQGDGEVDVISHRDGAPPTKTPLQFMTSAHTAGGPAAAEDVAYSQCIVPPDARGPTGRRDPGVIVVDTASGNAVSMLAREHGQACRLGARSWLTDDHLLVDDWVSGDMWVWDVPRNRVRQVATGETSGINVSVASEVLAERLGNLLRR